MAERHGARVEPVAHRPAVLTDPGSDPGRPRRVLMISHEFPPSGGVGVMRVLKFVKYLPSFGWMPEVLARRPGYRHNPRSEIRRMDELRPTRVREGATLGANCTIVCGTTIGRYAFVGAGAVVVRDVPDFALVVGNPARQVGWMCRCGTRVTLARDGARGTCPACGAAYRQDGEVVRPA